MQKSNRSVHIAKASKYKQGAELIFGGAGYSTIEILWRGYTHISMFLLGGFCFILLLRIWKTGISYGEKCILGASCISLLEFITGCVVNLWLGLNVWDYSHEFYHCMGQICLRFVGLWLLLCGVIFGLLFIAQHLSFSLVGQLSGGKGYKLKMKRKPLS